MKETQIIRLPLQFFAEGEDTGTETEGGSEGGSDGHEKAPTFDDILKDKSMQAEFDRRVSKAMEKQKASLIRATYIKPAEESLPRLHSYILILLPLLSYSFGLYG